jgi:hypothetical protein
MPVIREYRQQVSVPGPNRNAEYSADQFGAAEGRAIVQAGQAVQGVADVVAKRIDQENTSDITAKVTKANADLSIDLQETIRTAAPGDKKAFEDYNKRVEDTLGKIGEGAETSGARSFFGEASERIKGQLYKTSSQGQAELAGMKAVQDYTSSLNSLSTATAADPSGYKLQFELHNQAIENLVANGQLPRHKAMELKADGEVSLAKSTIRGWAQLDPDYAKKKLKDGEFNSLLGEEGTRQLNGEIEQAVRAKEIDIERRRIEQERNLDKQQRTVKNDFIAKVQDHSLNTKDVLNSILEPEQKEHYLNLIKTANSSEERLKTDAGVMMNLFTRMNLPDGDPKKITDEKELEQYFGRGLSFTDMNRLRDEFQGKNTEQGRIENDMKKQVMDIARGKLTKSNPLTGFKDPIGDENMARYMAFFFDEYKQRRQKGDTTSELLNPDSPKYLGKSISAYVRSPQEVMRDLAPKRTPRPGLALTPNVPSAEANAPKAQQRQAGESPAAYLKRIKGGG